MPVRLLNSSIMRWPSHAEVHSAIDQWVKDGSGANPPNWLAVGYFGSYARGEAGVGSDLDLVMVVLESDLPFERRATVWDFHAIPVPVEVSVYTLTEWQRLSVNQPRFYQTLVAETVWLQP
jgi:uncharacterized protein